jgi:hypothetical protein
MTKSKTKTKTRNNSKSRTVKKSNCKIIKNEPKISAKILNDYNAALNCSNTKCKKFIDRDIEIVETCFDKTATMKFKDPKRFTVEDKCYKKMGLVDNVIKKNKCIRDKCSNESNKLKNVPFDTLINIQNKINHDTKRFRERQESIFPEYKKLRKLDEKRNLITAAIHRCNDEKEKKKLIARKEKIQKEVAFISKY